ncbi:MAG: hypothetical protein HKN91_06145, partial [Acidimicrobiia bacterium]|nr:hypothetical protein [Acidimicrobiia bacterium]
MSDAWHPPEFLSAEEVIAASKELLGAPDIPVTESEDVFRINEVGLEWDIGTMIYEPVRQQHTASGAAIGVFLLHGGSGDFRAMEPFARLIAS